MVPRRVHRSVWSRSSRWLTTVALLSLVSGPPSTLRASGATDPEDLRTPLTAIAAIRALTPQVANQGHRVVIRGTITYINEREPAGIIVHGDESIAVGEHRKPSVKSTAIGSPLNTPRGSPKSNVPPADLTFTSIRTLP
jgi:hypothetical protein